MTGEGLQRIVSLVLVAMAALYLLRRLWCTFKPAPKPTSPLRLAGGKGKGFWDRLFGSHGRTGCGAGCDGCPSSGAAGAAPTDIVVVDRLIASGTSLRPQGEIPGQR